jgi:hypothetical protein
MMPSMAAVNNPDVPSLTAEILPIPWEKAVRT